VPGDSCPEDDDVCHGVSFDVVRLLLTIYPWGYQCDVGSITVEDMAKRGGATAVRIPIGVFDDGARSTT